MALALLVAVASVTTVGFFADRVQHALDSQANQLMAADLVISTDHKLDEQFEIEAKRRQLATANVLSFPSMASRADLSHLADIKAVSAGYPLRGKLRIGQVAFSADQEATGVPERGSIWIGEQMLSHLGIRIGDSIELGSGRFRVAALVTREPDNALDYFNIAPRVLMNLADVPSTELIQTGSRVYYRLLVAGDDAKVAQYRAWAERRVGRGERLEGIRDARPEVRAMLERAGRFLGLAALLSVILAAVAVALAARRFMQRHLDGCAMMRCLGASQRTIFLLHCYQFLFLGLAASALGCALGFAAQFVLVLWLRNFVTVALPLPTWMPALQGVITGMVLLLGFAVPPLLRLRGAPTLRVLRREVGFKDGYSVAASVLGFLAIAGLLLWKAGDARLAGYVLGGFAGGMLVSGALGWLLLRLLGRLRGRVGGAWRYGLASMGRRAGGSIVQMVALGLGIMALLLLTLVRGDLMQSWRKSVPPDAPNRFVINIQPGQVDDLRRFFAGKKLAAVDFYPMVRGRLMAINGKPVSAASYADERAKRMVEREFNLSWAQTLRPDNRLVAGRWWSAPRREAPEVSVEEWIAKELRIKIGDTLTYRIAGTSASATVTSIRKVDWDSFRVNFYVISTPGFLDAMPASYITSFHLPRESAAVLNELVRAFPNLTLIDVAALMQQVQAMTEQVAQAVQFVFLFTLLAGLMVLYSAIAATQDERLFEAAILRSLGARTRQILTGQLAEFLAIGFFAGLIAATGASALAYLLSVEVLNVPYHFDAWIPLLGSVGGAAAIALAGLIGTRSTVNVPPVQAIRQFA